MQFKKYQFDFLVILFLFTIVKNVWLIIVFSPALFLYAFFPPTELDKKISREISNLKRYDGVEGLFKSVSATSSTEAMLIYCVGMTAFGDSTLRATGKMASFSLAMTQLTTFLIKTSTNRERPSGPTNRTNSSFPSGHTSAAFSMAYTVGHYHPKLRIPLYMMASFVGISRIGLEEHWVTDVIAGAVVGVGISWATMKFEDKILKFEIK